MEMLWDGLTLMLWVLGAVALLVGLFSFAAAFRICAAQWLFFDVREFYRGTWKDGFAYLVTSVIAAALEAGLGWLFLFIFVFGLGMAAH